MARKSTRCGSSAATSTKASLEPSRLILLRVRPRLRCRAHRHRQHPRCSRHRRHQTYQPARRPTFLRPCRPKRRCRRRRAYHGLILPRLRRTASSPHAPRASAAAEAIGPSARREATPRSARPRARRVRRGATRRQRRRAAAPHVLPATPAKTHPLAPSPALQDRMRLETQRHAPPVLPVGSSWSSYLSLASCCACAPSSP